MLALMKLAPGPGNLALQEIEEPSPKQGQVMIEVEAAGLCASDLHIRDWDIQLKLKPPVVIGTHIPRQDRHSRRGTLARREVAHPRTRHSNDT